MKIQFCSDLHLEFANNRDWLKQHPIIPKGDVLIVAGDTYYMERDFSQLDFIEKVAQDFEYVYLIPGNHEYYGGFDISTALKPFFKEIRENVFLVNNYTIVLNNTRLIFSTMWSKIQRNVMEVMCGMTDFRAIKYKGEKFTVNHFNEIHEAAFTFISKEVKKAGKKIVITHHLPSNACNIEEYKGSVLNEAFCVDKTQFILDHDIDYWVYGHSHRNIKDFKIGKTTMVTNQLGYVGWNEHRGFDYEKMIEI